MMRILALYFHKININFKERPIMKRILFLLLIGLFVNQIFAQDIIVKKNGDEIKSKIVEIATETIKYRDFDFQDGPIRNINISDVFMVIYENGKREKFTKSEQEDNKNEKSKSGYIGNYFMIGIGYGNSYGGLGIRGQWRIGGKQGFGIHYGAGYLPEAPILATVGLKFFPYKGFYLNAQFGLTGYEEKFEYTYNGTKYESRLLYGPSFLIGGDFNWGRVVGYGFNVGLGLTYNINAENFSNVTLAADLGFIIRFWKYIYLLEQ